MNCRRIQSMLSAYLDGELTGEEMIAVRHHVAGCEFCSDEYHSLQVVKRLLGSMDLVDARNEWTSGITVQAYAGARPWWEKTISNEWLSIQLVRPLDTAELSPRGVRLVRALALSALFIFLAAVPISIEHMDDGVTGRIEANLAPSFFSFSPNMRPHVPLMGAVFQPEDPARYDAINSAMFNSNQHFDTLSASTMPSFVQPSYPSDNSLTLVAAASQK